MTNLNIPRDKLFFEWGDWIDILAENSFQHLSTDVRKRFVIESIEDGYRNAYYATLTCMDNEGPDWENLTSGQRENIRGRQRTYVQEMHDLSKSFGQIK